MAAFLWRSTPSSHNIPRGLPWGYALDANPHYKIFSSLSVSSQEQ